MGTWGTALFSDDEARDVRDEYLTLLGDGVESPRATDVVIQNWGQLSVDDVNGSVLWLALAATQWRCGRLEERVKSRALMIIDSGSDLERWKESSTRDLAKRRTLLSKLRDVLTSPQPPPKRIAKRFRNACEWDVGELISYSHRSGRVAILRVIGHSEDAGGRSAIFEVLDSFTEHPPDLETIKSLPIRKWTLYGGGSRVMVGAISQRESDRAPAMSLHAFTKPAQEPSLPYSVSVWRFFDDFLDDVVFKT